MRHEYSSGVITLTCLLLVLCGALAVPLQAQDDEFVPGGDDEFVPGEEAAPEGEDGLDETFNLGNEEDATDFRAIDEMLARDEEVLSDPGAYAYDPGARRDPFRSLLRRRSAPTQEEQERPEGAGGLLIDEIEVEGIFILPEGPVAQIQSSSQETSFLLRPGDQLWDGDVVSINLGEVVFKQSVNDPTALKPFREVTKRLNP
jgi:hypothetical protein